MFNRKKIEVLESRVHSLELQVGRIERELTAVRPQSSYNGGYYYPKQEDVSLFDLVDAFRRDHIKITCYSHWEKKSKNE